MKGRKSVKGGKKGKSGKHKGGKSGKGKSSMSMMGKKSSRRGLAENTDQQQERPGLRRQRL